MRIRKIVAISTCFILTTALIGCSKNTNNHSSSKKYIQNALTIINKANQGYAQYTNSSDKSTTYQQFRQDKLKNAIAPLKSAIAQGTPAQKATASALLAQIQVSQSRFLARKANIQYALWQAGTGNVISQAVSIDSASQRVNILQIDNSAGVKTLQSYIKKLQGQSATLKKQIKSEQAKVNAQKSIQAKLKNKANDLMAQAQKIHQKGFVESGDKKYDLYDKAAKLQDEAAKISFDAQRHQIKQEIHEKKITYLTIKLNSVLNGISKSNQRIKNFQTQQQGLDKAKAQAKEDIKQNVQKLITEFKKINQEYQNNVAKTYTKATALISKSVAALEKAQEQASASKKQKLQTQLLSSYISQANILLNQASTTKGFSSLIKLIAIDNNGHLKLQNNAGKTIDSSLKQLKESRAELIKQANNAIKNGEKIADNLAKAPNQISTIAKAQQKILDFYSKSSKDISS